MKAIGSLFALFLVVALAGCVAETRYWKADDLTSKRTFYTADTSAVPLGLMGAAIFVSSERTIVGLSSFELRRITEEEFFNLTGGVTAYQDLGGRVFFNFPEPQVPPGTTGEHKVPESPTRREDGPDGR